MSKKDFRCSKCGSIIDAREPDCPKCGTKQSYESRSKFLQWQLIDIKCPKCGCEKSFFATSHYFDISTCCECGAETSCVDKVQFPIPKNPLGIKCPYCGSTNTKKITGTTKFLSGITLGILAAGKLTKQWHCNNCKSDF